MLIAAQGPSQLLIMTDWVGGGANAPPPRTAHVIGTTLSS